MQNRSGGWGSSSYKGVSFYRAGKRYSASIFAEGKSHHLGFWDSPEEAARAYDQAALLFFGEYAKTNFPVDPTATPALLPHVMRPPGLCQPETLKRIREARASNGRTPVRGADGRYVKGAKWQTR